jgi:5'-nucleotidase
MSNETLRLVTKQAAQFSIMSTAIFTENCDRLTTAFLFFRHSLVKMLDGIGGELDGPPPLRRSSTVDNAGDSRHSPSPSPPHPHTHPHPPPHTHAQSRSRLTRRASLDDLEQETCQLSPKIEGRIVILTDEV